MSARDDPADRTALPPVDARDLDEICDVARDDVAAFSGAHLLVTGATGFVGTWLLESIVAANRRLGSRIRVTAPTRDPEAFRDRSPHLAGAPAIRLVRTDVRETDDARSGLRGERFDAVVHAATPASAALSQAAPAEMFATIVDGTAAVYRLAERSGRIPVLFTSSGAVYGTQPAACARLSENFSGAPDPLDVRSVYHEGKRAAEMLGAIATTRGALDVKTARLFAFVGPHLPLDRHFAVGNFLRDRLGGGAVVVAGDGTTVRSYQYASDLIAWLWRVLARGRAGRAYNVGSEEAYDLAAVARLTSRLGDEPASSVELRGRASPGIIANRYVPDTTRARTELGLAPGVALDEALRRTFAWHRRYRA